MTKREAKAEAYFRAAACLSGSLGAGWELSENTDDHSKICDAMYEIIASLERRNVKMREAQDEA